MVHLRMMVNCGMAWKIKPVVLSRMGVNVSRTSRRSARAGGSMILMKAKKSLERFAEAVLKSKELSKKKHRPGLMVQLTTYGKDGDP